MSETGSAPEPGGAGASRDSESDIERAFSRLELCALGRPDSEQTAQTLTGAEAGRGLTQLVLTLVRLIHELLERQAIRRLEAGTLSDDEIERVGTALMAQAEEIRRLCEVLGVEIEDLNLDLGPLGRLL
ncbi:MAG: gas vesicle protein K [Acidobacteriota bacterium]